MNTKLSSFLLTAARRQTAAVRALPGILNRAAAALGEEEDCPYVDGEMLLLDAHLDSISRSALGLPSLVTFVIVVAPVYFLALFAAKAIGFLLRKRDDVSHHVPESARDAVGDSEHGMALLLLLIATIYVALRV